MKVTPLLALTTYTVACLLSVANVLAQEAEAPLTGHVFYGKMNIAIDDPDLEEDDFGIHIFTEKIGLNVGARINETTLSLNNTLGEVDVEGWQYYCGIAVHF